MIAIKTNICYINFTKLQNKRARESIILKIHNSTISNTEVSFFSILLSFLKLK